MKRFLMISLFVAILIPTALHARFEGESTLYFSSGNLLGHLHKGVDTHHEELCYLDIRSVHDLETAVCGRKDAVLVQKLWRNKDCGGNCAIVFPVSWANRGEHLGKCNVEIGALCASDIPEEWVPKLNDLLWESRFEDWDPASW